MSIIILVIRWFSGQRMIDRWLCNKAFRARLGNIAYFLVVAYPPNGVLPIYALECKHSSHILSKLRLALNESIL